jgi:hypothetical protein
VPVLLDLDYGIELITHLGDPKPKLLYGFEKEFVISSVTPDLG